LWQRQRELLERAQSLLRACECRAGCPACVGPVLEEDLPTAQSPKALALTVLSAFYAV
jgi:DEAD/DEAH box helicase domain-containing protein